LRRRRSSLRVDSAGHTFESVFSWRRKTIARDTAILVLGLCLVAAVLTGLAAQQVIGASLRGSLEAELDREYQRVETALEMWRAEEVEDIAQLARDPALARALDPSSASSSATVRARLVALLKAEPEAIGLAVIRGRAARVEDSVALTGWLPERWAGALDPRYSSFEKAEFLRVEGVLVAIVPVPIALLGDGSVLVAALRPRTAFETVERSSRSRLAIFDDRGELIAGTPNASESPTHEGFAQARSREGASLVALRRPILGTPLVAVISLPQAGVPTGTLTSIVAASVLIATIAGVVAFAVGERRLRPLLELAVGARRLAAGETGVRVPVDDVHGEVRQLANTFNEMAGQLDAQRQALEERHLQLLRANEVLEQLSITDGLTHLHNHRHFHDQFAREVKRADRSGQPLCLLLIDVDDFKVLNDSYGHAAGDMVLAVAAQLMNAQVRESDYLARYGGEEFAMLLPQTRLDGAVALAEKLRSVLAEHVFTLPDSAVELRMTVSIGVAQHASTADETFDAADRALYDAKAAGKDCVMVARAVDRPAPLPRRRR
jgi:diguanylate cyclase (GGDEF)-like protein